MFFEISQALPPCGAQPSTRLWIELQNQAQRAENRHDWVNAALNYQRAIDALNASHANANNTLELTIKLGIAHVRSGRFELAEPIYKRVSNLDLGQIKDANTKRESLVWIDDFADAYASCPLLAPNREESIKHALLLKEHIYGKADIRLLKTLEDLYAYYHTHLNESAAIPVLQQTIQIMEHADNFADGHKLVMANFELGSAFLVQKKFKDARIVLLKTKPIVDKVYGPASPIAATCATQLAFALLKLGKLEEGLQWSQKAVKMRHTLDGEHSIDIARDFYVLARIYEAKADPTRAEQLYKQAIETIEIVGGRASPELIGPLNSFATLLAHQGRPAEAKSLRQRASALKPLPGSLGLNLFGT